MDETANLNNPPPGGPGRDATLSRGKKLLCGVLLVLGLIGLAEALSSLVYFLRLPDRQREAVELAIGLREAPANSVLRFAAHPYLGYVANPAFVDANGNRLHGALGFRGENDPSPKRPGQFRMVAIGGSTTYGLYATHEKDVWPALLQERLRRRFGERIEVVNAGVPNYTTFELIGQTALLLPELSPDLVLIHTGFNDAFTSGYLDEGGPDNRTFRHEWRYQPIPGWLRRGMRASYLVRIFGISWGAREGFAPGDMSSAIQYEPPPDDEMLSNARSASGKYFRRNLQTLLALCRNMNATAVLVDEPLNPLFDGTTNLYQREVIKAGERNRGLLKEIAGQNHVWSIDVYSAMRDPAFFFDVAHATPAGMAKKAAVIGDRIEPLVERLLTGTAPPLTITTEGVVTEFW